MYRKHVWLREHSCRSRCRKAPPQTHWDGGRGSLRRLHPQQSHPRPTPRDLNGRTFVSSSLSDVDTYTHGTGVVLAPMTRQNYPISEQLRVKYSWVSGSKGGLRQIVTRLAVQLH